MWRTIILLVSLCLLTAACNHNASLQPAEPVVTPALTGRITFAGSTTVQPLAAKLGEAFTTLHPGLDLEIAAGGSTVGIEAVHQGTVDIGMASRALKPAEQEGIEIHPIAVDVIAVVVHPSNPLHNLSLEQLQAIYRGEITNWEAVGGTPGPITVVVRDQNSGTRGAFDDIVLKGEAPQAQGLALALTAGDMAALVAQTPHAIGYVGFGNLEPTLKLVAIDGVMPTEAAAQSGAYRLVRPLLLLTGPLTQPQARAFVEFAVSPAGQQVVAANGWVPAVAP